MALQPVSFVAWSAALSTAAFTFLPAQELGRPDRENPGDEAIQRFLAADAELVDRDFLDGVTSAAEFEARRPRYREEYLDMLGLAGRDLSTPLEAVVTRTLVHDDVAIDMLHFQSLPGLYVTANLYRPARSDPVVRLPAVLYVCGHSSRGRDGNKTAFQSHGLWFARHGYVCLMVDTLQLGEIAGIHHGTYRERRWWWHSSGYASSAIECLNGIRAIDYLVARDDVDPARIAVTGISGGGAATFWIAAADERVACAVPVSGMADLSSYVGNRVINGHCDCMFLHNTYRWPWTRIAALIAPRPLLFVNSDADAIFPMDANERVIARLERLYSLYGRGDRVDTVVSAGGHAYREDLRRAVYRFINTHLKGDPRDVDDSEVDLVEDARGTAVHPIAPADLRVFPTDADLPADRINDRIDRVMSEFAPAQSPDADGLAAWREARLAALRARPFRALGDRVPPAREVSRGDDGTRWLEGEDGLRFPLERVGTVRGAVAAASVLVIARDDEDSEQAVRRWRERVEARGATLFVVRPRGVGPTRWTRRDPPNYVERSHVLLGRTVDAERVRDVIAACRYLRDAEGLRGVAACGSVAGGVLAAYASLLAPDTITAVEASDVPASHFDANAPAFLAVLRDGFDIPQALGLLAPRELVVDGIGPEFATTLRALYAAAGASTQLHVTLRDGDRRER